MFAITQPPCPAFSSANRRKVVDIRVFRFGVIRGAAEISAAAREPIVKIRPDSAGALPVSRVQ